MSSIQHERPPIYLTGSIANPTEEDKSITLTLEELRASNQIFNVNYFLFGKKSEACYEVSGREIVSTVTNKQTVVSHAFVMFTEKLDRRIAS
tara:strand:- start:9 stop:284 length:276 start_codon:yes stop_codon:yes gene_type:complete